MLTKTFFLLTNRSPRGRKIAFRILFEYLARKHRNFTRWTQMNYGFAGESESGHTVSLDPADEWERYCHQLYHRIAGNADLAGKDVVEVSCGRGGGAAFIHRHFKTRSVIGIDIAENAIAFCRRRHLLPQLRFLQGDAEDIPLFDESADALINVEASFCYGDIDRFFAEVRRVLRPDGHFLYADLRSPSEVEALVGSLRKSGLEILEWENITANVVHALKLDSARRRELERANVPWFLRHAIRTFAGAPGTRIPSALENGDLVYLVFKARRPPVRDGSAMVQLAA
ncbi:MAG TPA: class I SAM-dependent methyltransferase [Micropepsaceae bacterium]|nr:class I SAM-dependent methyltransferase [Micropepsaceae bacterium]